jgi:hypothetical protein
VRNSDRKAVDEAVRLHPNDWSSLEVRLIDCSETGFRAACEARVQSGLLVTLELPGLGPRQAQVSWANGREFGARFIEPLEAVPDTLRPASEEVLLARLLVKRAGAHKARCWRHETALREEILKSLPVRRL